jgi:hypothetical protein
MKPKVGMKGQYFAKKEGMYEKDNDFPDDEE